MGKQCDRCENRLCASKIAIFENLSKEELIGIIKMTGHRQYKKGELIFLEGSEASTLYLINEGKIKLYKYTKDGKQQILHILSDGEVIGELNLFKQGEYTFNAEAITPLKVCTLTKEKMKKLILDEPTIGLKILEVMGERLINLENLVQNLSTNDAEIRVAYLLLELSDKYGKITPKGIEVPLPITREEMSNYTGVARETISRKLKKLEEEHIIELIGTKKIRIVDKEKLEDYL